MQFRQLRRLCARKALCCDARALNANRQAGLFENAFGLGAGLAHIGACRFAGIHRTSRASETVVSATEALVTSISG
jgi:hypothetical protein